MKALTFLFIMISIPCFSQDFYVNTFNSSYDNNMFLLNTQDDSVEEHNICLPTNGNGLISDSIYFDLATDAENDMYFVTPIGSLYKKSGQDGTCEFLGGFPESPFINSLVAGANKILYAAGYDPNTEIGMLYTYDGNTGVFTTLGSLPDGQTPSGDLFFYNDRLFVVCGNLTNPTNPESAILEINLENTETSCYYMSLEDLIVFGAFTVFKTEDFTYCYIMTSNDPNDPQNSALIEIYMETQEIGDTIRTYDFPVYGADAYYKLNSTYPTCQSLGLDNLDDESTYFNFIVPSSNLLKFNTNIPLERISNISAYNHLGQKVISYSTISTSYLNTSKLKSGIYLFQVEIDDSSLMTRRVVIK